MTELESARAAVNREVEYWLTHGTPDEAAAGIGRTMKWWRNWLEG